MKDLGTILGVWAHPDDETWGCGGIMALARSRGQRVVCVTATRGEAGKSSDEKRWPASELGKIRVKELESALEILGVDEHYWLDYPDGGLAQADTDKAILTISKIIVDVQPDTIFTFGHDGLTGHSDHKVICKWSCKAAKRVNSKAIRYGVCEAKEKYQEFGKELSERFDIYFKTKHPRTVSANKADLFIKLSPDILILKMQAFRALSSQTNHFFRTKDDSRIITQLLASECFMRLD